MVFGRELKKKNLRPRFLLPKSHTQASISCCSYKSLFVSNSFTPLALLAAQKSLPYFAAYLVFPKSHGTYLFSLVSMSQDCFVGAGSASILLNPINFTLFTHLYLIILWICFLIVKITNTSQYITNTGQNTGRLKISLQLHAKLKATALVAECQNLNSGSLRTNGLNS